jgi:error-prone DNA polymerase
MYAELHAKTNFSFLEGASHPDELICRAAELGYRALAITDRNSLAGVVRAHGAAKEEGVKLIIGAEITPEDAPPVVLWATDRDAYGRLARLITRGRRRAKKGECRLCFDDIAQHAEGLLAGIRGGGRGAGGGGADERGSIAKPNRHKVSLPSLLAPSPSPPLTLHSPLSSLLSYRDVFADRCYLLAELHRGPDDRRKWEHLQQLSRQTHIPLVAAGDVHYHLPERAVLHDVLTAIRHGCTVAEATPHLFPNAQRHLKSPAEMAALFADAPDVLRRTVEIADRCTFSLDELRYEYPEELAPPGRTPGEYLVRLTWAGARRRYPRGVPEKVRGLLEHELQLIAELHYEAYFLTVWDLVRFARRRGILCQGRGSAANSAVCYCLGITAVDPERMDVLFERFVSRQRNEAPDIDVDFEHQRREEVLQYLYRKYGRQRAGMTAEVITYRPRSAVRDVGKALGLSPACVDLLAKQVEHSREEWKLQVENGFSLLEREGQGGDNRSPRLLAEGRNNTSPLPLGEGQGVRAARVAPQDCDVSPAAGPHPNPLPKGEGTNVRPRRMREGTNVRPLRTRQGTNVGWQLIELVGQLIGFPRHLSQHTGGMVMTRGPLCELVPIENAAMPERTVIQWNKDDLDELGILKVDCLALGMLTAVRRAFGLVWRHYGRKLTLANIPEGDEAVYAMIRRADTMGVFQIESRAQMSMLPRLGPRSFYDLVIEVAIVRPGPIQGDMVHPYLRRRNGEEAVTYPSEAIRGVLEKTLGVPLFQEQAMRLAMVAAGFTPGEADQLRRAMGAWRRSGVIEQMRHKLIDGMRAHGLSAEYAEAVFRQIRGFGDYGFPESHAASFALLVYVSAWLKHHYPAAFTASLLNSQPMGFYAPAQLVDDARQHDVDVLPVDVNYSAWECTLEERSQGSGDRGQGAGGGGRGTRGGEQKAALPAAAKEDRTAGPNSTNTAHCPLTTGHWPPTTDHYSLRLGFNTLSGMSAAHVERIERTRGAEPFRSLDDFARRTGLSRAVITRLAKAGTFGSLRLDRRTALWEALGQDQKKLPLFDRRMRETHQSDAPVHGTHPEFLPAMSAAEEVLADYRTGGLSLRAHPLEFLRTKLEPRHVVTAEALKTLPHGQSVCVAGIVLVRQRPSAAKGITFVTLEDETGTANLIIRSAVWRRYREAALAATLLLAHGRLQRQGQVIHVLTTKLVDLSPWLRQLGAQSRDFR